MKLRIKDTVQVTTGKDAGKTGEITQVLPKKNKIIVKNINQYKRHLKPQEGFEGGIVTRQRPISTAKVALICPTCSKTTRVGYRIEKSGSKTRICKKCQSSLETKTKSKPNKKS